MTRPPCSVCGVSAHRYGTSDPEHEYDAMGCVNSLLGELEVLRRALELACADYDYSLSGYDDYIEHARRLIAAGNHARLVALGVDISQPLPPGETQ